MCSLALAHHQIPDIGGEGGEAARTQLITPKVKFGSLVSATSAKSKCPEANGNHDIWVCGNPGCGDENDNFGIGQMQWHGDNLD